MSASFYELLKYAKTGIASPTMTGYDKLKALAMAGGFPVSTLSGIPPISFKSDGTPLISWEILANMVQDGTPTPISITMPQEFGDKTANIISEIISDKAIDASGTIYTNTDFIIISASVSQNEDYTFSLDSGLSDTTCRIHAYNGDTWIEQIKASNISKAPFTVTTPSGTTKLMISVTNGAASKRPMIVSGSTAPTSYIPYGWQITLTCAEQTYTVYLSEPLRKIGDYADTISSTGTVTRQIKKIVLDGTENWTVESGTTYAMSVVQVLSGYHDQICSHYQLQNSYANVLSNDNSFAVSGRPALFIHDNACANATALKAYLATQYAAGTPVCVWYVLQEPTTEQITAPTITPAKGANTLSIGTTLQPSEVSITGHIKS